MQLRTGRIFGFAFLLVSLHAVAQTTRPTAVDDRAVVGNSGRVTIPVLDNDSGNSSNALFLTKVGKPKFGTAVIKLPANSETPNPVIVYTANSSFAGYDSFTYTVSNVEGGGDGASTSTATVSVFGPGFALSKSVGTTITNAEGRTVGFVQIEGMRSGVFSGKLKLGHERYALLGSLGRNGRYSGFARSSNNDILPVKLSITDDGGTTVLEGTFGSQGEWTASQEFGSLTKENLAALEGRYTVELPSTAAVTTDNNTDDDDTNDGDGDGDESSGGDVPQGSGWMLIEVNELGEARLKGRTGDGRPFSVSTQIAGKEGEIVLPFFEVSDAALLGGSLQVGETIEGNIDWTRGKTDEDRFPNGFDVTIAARGARYIKPEKGKRALDGETTDGGRATLTISGGGVDEITREFRFSEGDDVTNLTLDGDPVSLEIDRGNGTFKGKFRDPDNRETRVKFTGVLLQNEGRGVGLFEAETKTGRVELKAETPSDEDDDGTDDDNDGTDDDGADLFVDDSLN